LDIKIDIQHLEDRECRLIIEGVHPYFVNALRRTLLSEVPKLAIHKVTFYDNTSALFDEVVAHRIGLLPVPTDPSTLNLVGQVDAEGNPTYMVRYTLTKEGPCTVYSGDMEPESPDFAIADPKVPIVELLEGQRLILEAEAILGIGTTHAKWQVCSAVGYKYFPSVTIDNGKIAAELREFAVQRTPAGILGLEDGKLVVLQPEEVNRADDVERYLVPSGANKGKTLREVGGFRVDYDDRRFIFRFETDGSLKAEDAMLKAVEILKERFKAFQEAVQEL
jgi:DNA-directed RNA polymerase subunit D